MTKLKQFYKNNEKSILFLSGLTIGAFTTSFIAANAADGMQLVRADVFEIADKTDKILRITFKNGTAKDYLWEATNFHQ